MELPEISELKTYVEQEFGRKPHSTNDFDELELAINTKVPDGISVSTLKRIWGYVKDKRKMRRYTLDSLARYIDFKDFDTFVNYLKTSTKYNSSFFNAMQIHSNELKTGQHLQIGWSPNRLLTLEYLGDSKYEIQKAENSKLKEGDRFITGCFIMEQPLYLPFIERNHEQTTPFVAGRNGGITVINIID